MEQQELSSTGCGPRGPKVVGSNLPGAPQVTELKRLTPNQADGEFAGVVSRHVWRPLLGSIPLRTRGATLICMSGLMVSGYITTAARIGSFGLHLTEPRCIAVARAMIGG